MIITVDIDQQTLKEIQKVISKNGSNDLHSFIKYAVKNQIELEKEGIRNPNLDLSVGNQKSEDQEFKHKEISLQNLKIKPKKLGNLKTLNSKNVKKRTNKPIWAIKNRYFPIKFVLRFLQNQLSNKNTNGISIDELKDKLLDPSLKLRKDLKNLDELLDNTRGKKISTGFPKNKKRSYNRFFKNFVIYRGKNSVDGFPYQLGFIDLDNDFVYLTKTGYDFSNLNSPILDKYYRNSEKPSYQFSTEELKFLYNHIFNYTISEKNLFLFIISLIDDKSINKPSKINNKLGQYLENNYPKEGEYTKTTINSIRTGLVSRMSELKLIRIMNKGGKSVYEITTQGKNMGEKYGN